MKNVGYAPGARVIVRDSITAFCESNSDSGFSNISNSSSESQPNCATSQRVIVYNGVSQTAAREF